MSGILSDAYSLLADPHSTMGSQFAVISNFLRDASANQSNIYSYVSDFYSDFQSRVTGAVATASDVASKVWAEKYTAASNVKASTFGSALRLNMSRISDTQSYLVVMSGILSDSYSALVALSDAVSNAYSAAVVGTSRVTLVLS